MLHYKKSAFWIIIVAVIACLVLSVGFLTNPKEEKDTSSDGISDTSELMVSENRSENSLPEDKNVESEPDGESSEESDPDSDRTPLPDDEISAEFRSIAVNSIGSVQEAAEEADCFYAETEDGIDIVKFDTCSQLNLFVKHLQEDAEGNQFYSPQINTLSEPYDEQFFENNSLLVLVTREASGSNENYLNNVYRRGEVLTINMKKILGDTDDFKILFNCLEFKKEEIAYCTDFSIEMTMREDYPIKTVDIQHVNLSPEEVTAYLNYTSKELHTETFLLCLDRAEDVQSLRASLGDASPFAFALSVYDETFFEENSLYLFYSQQASVDDDLEPAKYMTAYRYLVTGTFKPLTEELEIKIEFGKNLSSNSSPVPRLLLFGLERNEWSDVSYTIKTETFEENELRILNVSAEQKELLRELLGKAADGAILIGVNGQETVLPAEGVASSLYNNANSFVETTEGHLYDGLFEVWIIYSDGTVLGMYSKPIESVPEAYASCAGRMYGVQYHVDLIGDTMLAKTIYGYLPTEALDLPLEQIGY